MNSSPLHLGHSITGSRAQWSGGCGEVAGGAHLHLAGELQKAGGQVGAPCAYIHGGRAIK